MHEYSTRTRTTKPSVVSLLTPTVSFQNGFSEKDLSNILKGAVLFERVNVIIALFFLFAKTLSGTHERVFMNAVINVWRGL